MNLQFKWSDSGRAAVIDYFLYKKENNWTNFLAQTHRRESIEGNVC